jgi:hypothetical protein
MKTEYLKAAVQNIATHGDTDVFPFPLENHIFFDKESETIELLEKIDKEFNKLVREYPPINENSLAVVGYTGLRSVTQIDPVWNAYLLGLVISIGDEIEAARIPIEKQTVFAYRFHYDDDKKTLFQTDIGWPEFQKRSVELAREHTHVLICDIADFYPRVYHHRLKNALDKVTKNKEVVWRIVELLSRISKEKSFGLPIGGPAARLLSELLLNRVDRLLAANGTVFCRFVDDYHIFVSSEEEAYGSLVFLSEKLLENEGLSLQKSKTRVMTREEFVSVSEFADPDKPADPDEKQARALLSIRIRFDPYSPTAVEDYEELKKELNRFDIAGMLVREIGKSRIHQALTKRLINAVKYLDDSVRADAVRSLVANLTVLYPVFPNVMILLKAVLPELEEETRLFAFEKVRELIRSRSHVVKVPVNLGFAIRILADDSSEEAEELLVRTYTETSSMMVRRDVILIMAKRNADYWISDSRQRFYTLTAWEKRSLIIASYMLEDEGHHWRKKIGKEISPIDDLSRSWAEDKKNKNQADWSIPI